ncbi:MAG: FtsW/RodA/SpoVE family cell cycle protein [Puniceicoccaceae bacterium]
MLATESQRIWSYTVGRRLPVVFLALSVLFLNGLGLIMLLSIGRAYESGMGGYFFRQCLWVGIALTAFIGAVSVDYERLRKLSWWIALGGIVLLVLVLVPGIGLKINGARRWIDIGPMNMQVSDVAKIGYVMCLAQYFSLVQRDRQTFLKGFTLPIGIIGLFFGLILLQPDFGTAFLFAAVGGIMLFLGGVNLKYLIPTSVIGVAGFAYAIARDPVRSDRIMSFLDVQGNRSEGAYQLWQGIIGFAVGGVDGVGLGNSRQQFAFLPEAHTDFIFPIIGEELGLLFTLSVLAAFLLFFLVTWHQLQKAPNLYQFLLVSGSLLFITLQAMINMGVSTGCLPTKGMSLPFISYGGSNLVMTYILFGIICRCVWKWNGPPELEPRESRL